ncbi:hypothetical protein Q73A0000_03470 [Kaistella flava (ex Peng et al. 2021)]|uniref:Uncharacterized protein n=1 Tax=Kaistella flava (ex Peng et al. 2021) TaxID=2038776 RepID=A0A7M2Y5X0_9FLAO|nr:hypothetical protein [Kaistella flava (ex Peng et al. 2021)]QOW09490.1 hypothetical protein Q73A0000_03470 [Kaistella flava (ex Peng et al. 2021)]
MVGLSLLIISCRSSDDSNIEVPEPESFFNLNVDNQWVYKTYDNPDFTNPQSVSTFSGRIDSVSIVGKVEVQGLTFAKERTKINWPNSNLNNQENFRYLRVNNKGHLVYLRTLDNVTETSGSVVHPGQENAFTFSYDFIEMNQVVGNLFYKLDKEKNVEVNGVQYVVLPYLGDFTPAPNQSNLLKKTQEISYKKGLGLVKEICHSVYSKSYLESRLISYKIKK